MPKAQRCKHTSKGGQVTVEHRNELGEVEKPGTYCTSIKEPSDSTLRKRSKLAAT